jgi:hypothetical protein
MSKASEEALADLHGAVALGLTEVISKGQLVAVKEDGEELRASAPAAYFMAAITMLKNNSVTVDPSDNEALSELHSQLSKKRSDRKQALSKEGINAAAQILERDLGGFDTLQ